MIKPHGLYFADLSRVIKLFRLQLVVESPAPHKILKRIPLGNLDEASDRKFLPIRAFSLSHETLATFIDKKYP
jgi:hypothetical protein